MTNHYQMLIKRKDCPTFTRLEIPTKWPRATQTRSIGIAKDHQAVRRSTTIPICNVMLIAFTAAALTAGLASYFLGLMRDGSLTDVSNSAEGLKEFIIASAWSRGKMKVPIEKDGDADFIESDVKVVFNGVDLTQEACKWTPEGGRDSEECEYPFEESSTTTAGPTSTEGSTTTEEFTSTTEPPGTTWTDLPTLTNGGGGGSITTPEGSYCASTITTTSCHPGSGGQTICRTGPACASWAASTTTFEETTTQPPEPTRTFAPFKIRNLKCHDESDFPNHVDIRKKGVENGAIWVCEKYDWFKKPVGPGRATYVQEYWEDEWGAKYHFAAGWIEGCETTVEYQFPDDPFGIGGGMCKNIFWDLIWGDCNNGGVGGTIDAGCLRYNLEAGIPSIPGDQRVAEETTTVEAIDT